MPPRWTQRTIVLALAASAGFMAGCIADVDDPEIPDEQVVEVGHELEADGLPGSDAEGLASDGLGADAPLDGQAPPSPGSDVADPEPTPWEPPSLEDPEPTPWGDPNRHLELLQGSSTTS